MSNAVRIVIPPCVACLSEHVLVHHLTSAGLQAALAAGSFASCPLTFPNIHLCAYAAHSDACTHSVPSRAQQHVQGYQSAQPLDRHGITWMPVMTLTFKPQLNQLTKRYAPSSCRVYAVGYAARMLASEHQVWQLLHNTPSLVHGLQQTPEAWMCCFPHTISCSHCDEPCPMGGKVTGVLCAGASPAGLCVLFCCYRVC